MHCITVSPKWSSSEAASPCIWTGDLSTQAKGSPVQRMTKKFRGTTTSAAAAHIEQHAILYRTISVALQGIERMPNHILWAAHLIQFLFEGYMR